jgi:hypothetical protein
LRRHFLTYYKTNGETLHMTAIQLARLKEDYAQCENYAIKLKKRGATDRFNKIMEKLDFIDKKIAEVAA